jgi:hypothetical protein
MPLPPFRRFFIRHMPLRFAFLFMIYFAIFYATPCASLMLAISMPRGLRHAVVCCLFYRRAAAYAIIFTLFARRFFDIFACLPMPVSPLCRHAAFRFHDYFDYHFDFRWLLHFIDITPPASLPFRLPCQRLLLMPLRAAHIFVSPDD